MDSQNSLDIQVSGYPSIWILIPTEFSFLDQAASFDLNFLARPNRFFQKKFTGSLSYHVDAINIASPRLLASRSVLVCKRLVNWQGEAKPSLSSSQASCKPKQTWMPKVEGCYIFYCARLMLLNPYLGYTSFIRGMGVAAF